ncbi:hypothetical protein DSL92_06965 [Billgrantia gudaonensis]|uniref:Uncharacterized protein n=1 Tax=Billgrantia gudaonensis TaxID=376427 RepID=A0A3S0NEK4_9GAMM|nr:hypothetical protein DSL92_06965 [Halomonas gudaonensis]
MSAMRPAAASVVELPPSTSTNLLDKTLRAHSPSTTHRNCGESSAAAAGIRRFTASDHRAVVRHDIRMISSWKVDGDGPAVRRALAGRCAVELAGDPQTGHDYWIQVSAAGEGHRRRNYQCFHGSGQRKHPLSAARGGTPGRQGMQRENLCTLDHRWDLYRASPIWSIAARPGYLTASDARQTR